MKSVTLKLQHFLCIAIVLLLSTSSWGNQQVDSLMAVVNADKASAETYNQLAQEYWFIDMNQSKVFALEALKRSLAEKDTAQEGFAYNRLGTAFLYTDQLDSSQKYYEISASLFDQLKMYTAYAGACACCAKVFEAKHEYAEAINAYKNALAIFDQVDISEYYVQTLIVVGNLYAKLGDYKNAEKYLFEARKNKDYLKLNDQILIYNYLGVNYQNLGDFKNAIHNFEEAFRSCDLGEDNIALATTYINTGKLYIAWNKNDAALEYLEKGFDLAKTAGIEKFCRTILPLMADIYLESDDLEKAKACYNQLFDYISATNDVLDEARAYYGLARIASKQTNYREAIANAQKALTLYETVQRPFYQSSTHCLLAENYLLLGNYSKTRIHLDAANSIAEDYTYQELKARIILLYARYFAHTGKLQESQQQYEAYLVLNDSVFAAKNQELLARYQVELDNLEKDLELKEAENINQLKELDLVQKRRQITYIGIISILLLAGTIVFAIMYIRKQRANRILFLKNKELLEQENKSIKKADAVEISEALQIEIIEKLTKEINQNKIHLRNDLSLHSLSKILGTNSSYLSKIIQLNYNTNFSAYLNKYRIKEAQKMILDSSFNHYTIDAISQECGYNSKSTFNKAFKEITGLTPKEYKRQDTI